MRTIYEALVLEQGSWEPLLDGNEFKDITSAEKYILRQMEDDREFNKLFCYGLFVYPEDHNLPAMPERVYLDGLSESVMYSHTVEGGKDEV